MIVAYIFEMYDYLCNKLILTYELKFVCISKFL